jgi:hypothetical protein
MPPPLHSTADTLARRCPRAIPTTPATSTTSGVLTALEPPPFGQMRQCRLTWILLLAILLAMSLTSQFCLVFSRLLH